MLGDVGQDQIGRDRRHLIEPCFAELALDVVFFRKAESAMGLHAGVGRFPYFLDHPNGTSRHLHFDVQVFTRDGWIWVNPYVTLISAYERLIGGRGREPGPELPPSPLLAGGALQSVVRSDVRDSGGN